MIESLKKEITAHDDNCQIVSIERLHDLKRDLHEFEEQEDLNKFQKYIVNRLYNLEIPDCDFVLKSIIIIAVPRPAYANVEFIWQGNKYLLKSLAVSDFDSEDPITATMKYLQNYLEPLNLHLEYAQNLPLKRLAVRSGLAVYGRNNICYVNGMGSFLQLVAYYTDVECTEDNWNEIKHADICLNCRSCINSCPTDAIRNDQFLIDNERCLSYYNESPGEFPDWIPLTAHNCVYDCLKCQTICPMNQDYVGNVIGPVQFNEDETHMLLEGNEFDTSCADFQKKIKMLGMDRWFKAIPRNLKTLFELYSK